MKKILFSFLATILIASSSNAFKLINPELEKIKPKKNAVFYAVTDAGGAWAWGSTGTTFGPAGTAAGIVLGGICTSAWSWYWDHKSSPIVISNPKDTFALSYKNDFEKSGYLHNKLLITFLNNNKIVYINSDEFIDGIYDYLSVNLAAEYNLNINEFKKQFTKNSLKNMIKDFDDIADDGDVSILIDESSKIIDKNYSSKNLSNYYNEVTHKAFSQYSSSQLNIESFVNVEIEKINLSNDFNENEKNIIKNSLNVFKYSFSLWSNN